MPNKAIILCCLLAVFCHSPCLYAQYKLEQPVMIGKDQGIPTNGVRSISKGKDGFMWMGTTEGLCRFDGQQVKLFKQGEDPARGPFDNSVLAVLPMENEIWMGTNQGISVMSVKDERFRHYQLTDKGKDTAVYPRFDQAVTVLYRDRQGETWVGTRDRGAWIYDKKKDDFRNFRYPPEAYVRPVPSVGPNTVVLCIEQSAVSDSIIWVGTTAGLQQINKYSGKVNWYTFLQKDKVYQVALNAFRRIYAHPNGLLYVGSWEAGMNVFDPVQKTFSPLPVKKNARSELLKGNISSIYKKTDNEFWISTSAGLVLYDINRQEVTWYKKNQQLESKFFGVNFIDEENRIWNLTYNGLEYFDPVAQQFSTYSFKHLFDRDWAFTFFIDSDGSGNIITVCPLFTDALYRFDRQSGEWEKIPFRNIRAFCPDRFTVRGFVKISEGRYFLSTDQGLFSFSEASGLLSPSSIRPPVKYNRWGEVMKDRQGNYWISADADGLVKWNMETGRYHIYKEELEIGEMQDFLGRVLNFYEDSRGNIWFYRFGGFSVYLPARDSMINFLYSRDSSNSLPFINSFAEDKTGKIWVASSDGWYGYIQISQPEKGITRKFLLKDIGISGQLHELSADKQGNVWGHNNKELIRLNALNIRGRKLSTFDLAYGARDIDILQMSFLPTGELVIGGRNSITIANPATFRRNPELPVPYITGMEVLNRQMQVELFSGPEIRLRPRQNYFSVSFSAKAYSMPQDLRFRYRLKGFDDWKETSEHRFANYTNVPPGNYSFQLQVANNEGMWNPQTLELPLYISTPWWQTWWFRVGGLLVVAGLVYWLYRYRISQVRKKEKLKSQYEKRLANVEMSALLAQMNPHFLFNSLNSIDSYIIRNESRKASEYLNNFARLMRLILQNSRSNYISLKDELEALNLYLQMEGLRFGNRFQYELIVDPSIDIASTMIPPMLIQPYVENAIWHGLMHKQDGKAGKVEIRIDKQEESLHCVIEDNGIGRERAQQLREQKSGNHKRSMGMQITRDRIDMINKLYSTDTRMQVVDLKDEEGNARGTRVELLIPV